MELVKPEVPNAQLNRAPDLLLEGLRGGLSFMAQMNQQRRQSESDAARMALQERLANKEHDFNASKMAQDYELQDRRLSIDESLLEPRMELLDAQAEYHRTTKGASARQTAAKIATLNDFNKQVSKYGLDDPNPRDPVAFYANVRRLKDEFSWANIPEVKHSLKQIDMRTKEHTIPLQVNQEVKDEDGETVIKSVEKFVPIGEIIEGLKDPKKHDNVMRTLERSGLMKEDSPIPANKVLREFIQAETKRVEAGGGTDFSRGSSRVAPGGALSDPADEPLPEDTAYDPQAALRQKLGTREIGGEGYDPSATPSATPFKPYDMFKSMGPDNAFGPNVSGKTVHSQAEADEWYKRGYRKAGEPTAQTDVDESNLFGSIGQTDKYLAQARAALQRGASPKAVAERLRGFGVSPDQLWAT